MQSEQQGPVKDMPCPLPKSTGSQMLLSNVTKVLCLSFTTERSFSLSLSVGTKTALSQEEALRLTEAPEFWKQTLRTSTDPTQSAEKGQICAGPSKVVMLIIPALRSKNALNWRLA